jgi:multidrug resistance efflux pump
VLLGQDRSQKLERYVEGYFEETKLRRIRIGEVATVKLIGDSRVLSGRVESIAYGIEDQNRSDVTIASVTD